MSDRDRWAIAWSYRNCMELSSPDDFASIISTATALCASAFTLAALSFCVLTTPFSHQAGASMELAARSTFNVRNQFSLALKLRSDHNLSITPKNGLDNSKFGTTNLIRTN